MNLNIKELPKCPKCNGKLLPLSGVRDGWGSVDFVLPIAEWKCSKCRYRRKGESSE